MMAGSLLLLSHCPICNSNTLSRRFISLGNFPTNLGWLAVRAVGIVTVGMRPRTADGHYEKEKGMCSVATSERARELWQCFPEQNHGAV